MTPAEPRNGVRQPTTECSGGCSPCDSPWRVDYTWTKGKRKAGNRGPRRLARSVVVGEEPAGQSLLSVERVAGIEPALSA